MKTMATKGVIIYIRRFINNHPFLVGMAFFFFLLHRFFPSAFSWLVSTLPVIVCTILLLGTILCYGEPNIPEIEKEEEKKPEEMSSLIVYNDLVFKRDESLNPWENVDGRREILIASSIGATSSGDPSSLVGRDEKEREIEKPFNKDEEVSDRMFKRGLSVRRLGRAVSNVDGYVGEVPSKDHEGNTGLKMESKENGSKNSSDSKSESETESETDHSESSSSDASMTDVMPILDELHPLLDSEPPGITHKSSDGSYGPSQALSQNQESDDDDGGGDSAEEEAVNQEEDEEEDAQEEKDDGSDGVVKWTADDQKNLMDLGTSELERNQRLENLIAKRRAKKIQGAEMEKNLIDLDSNDPAPIVEELSRLLVNTQPITATRRNPFELPDEPDNPGSAPSILLPRRNPFDLPYEHEYDSSRPVKESLSPPEPVAAQQRDMLFRRHESFHVGPSFCGNGNSSRHPSIFKPYFITERTNLEEPGFHPFERQLNEKSDLKVSSSPKSESSSSSGDGENNKLGLEQEQHRDGAFGLPASDNDEHVERESKSSKEGDPVDAEQEHCGLNVGGEDGIDLNTSDVIEETHQITDISVGEEAGEDVRHEGVSKSKMIEEKYDESGSSPSLEADEKSVNTNSSEEAAASLERTKDSIKGSNDSVRSVLADSDLQSRAMEKLDDDQRAEPVYDSSPSAMEKSLSNFSALHEALFYGGKGSFNSSISLCSDMQVETSEVDATPWPVDKNFFSGDDTSISSTGCIMKGLAPVSGGLRVASSNLSSVEDNESQSREVTEIRELDVTQGGFAGFHEDFSTPMACVMPQSPAVQFAHHSSFASMRTHSSEYSSMEEDVSLPSDGDGDGDEMTNDSTFSDRDKLVISDDLASSAMGRKTQTKEPADPPSSNAGIEEFHNNNLGLGPITEDKLAELKLGEEHQNMIHHAAHANLTGLQIIEEHNGGLSDMEKESSLESLEKSEDGHNKISLGYKPKIDATAISISHLQQPTEIMEDMKPELEIGYDGDLNNSEDSSNESCTKDKEIRGESEGLPSEPDASGDYTKQLKSDERETEKGTQFDGNVEALMEMKDGFAKVGTRDRHLKPGVVELESAVEIQFTYKEAGIREATA